MLTQYFFLCARDTNTQEIPTHIRDTSTSEIPTQKRDTKTLKIPARTVRGRMNSPPCVRS